MTSYLVDAILVLALLVTAVRVSQMHRELVKLRRDQVQFCGIMGEAANAFETIVKTVNDLNRHGSRLIQLLGTKIDEAREVIAEIEERAPRTAGDDGHRPVLSHGEARRG